MYAIINVCIFDLQVLGDLMMCILFYDDQQEHELEYKEKIHLILLYALYGLLCILMYIFKCMVCTNAAPGFFNFLCTKCFVIDLRWRQIW